MIPTREALFAKAASVPAPPVAIEAFWDGDTTGWFVVLTAIYIDVTPEGPRYREFDLGAMRGDDGDLRIFNGQVPPWPEAERTNDVGREIAARFGVPFYFPSPGRPDDNCPRWWDTMPSSPR